MKIVLGTFGPEHSKKYGRYHSALHMAVTVEVEDRDGKTRLSICGETYYPGVRDIESGDQNRDDLRALLDDPQAHLNFERAQLERLLKIWDRWHLNDMRAGCEHQRLDWDTSEKLILVTYQETTNAMMARHAIEKAAEKRLRAGETVTYTPEELATVRREWRITLPAEAPAPGPAYEEKRRDEKTAGWVTPREHPRGLLAAPCPTCGYKYGTAWLYEPIPADVLAFLAELPTQARGD